MATIRRNATSAHSRTSAKSHTHKADAVRHKPTASKFPEVATLAKAVVTATAAATKAQTQVAMVAGSVDINNAMDAVLKRTAETLSDVLGDHGQHTRAKGVTKEVAAFFKEIGAPRGYRLDPERGTMGSLEDNGDRLTKVMGKMSLLAAELGEVNKEPANWSQSGMTESAWATTAQREAQFAVAFQKAVNGPNGDKAIAEAQKFFERLPGRVDAQIDSRGGTLEPMERASATSTALELMTAKLDGAVPPAIATPAAPATADRSPKGDLQRMIENAKAPYFLQTSDMDGWLARNYGTLEHISPANARAAADVLGGLAAKLEPIVLAEGSPYTEYLIEQLKARVATADALGI